MKLSSILDCIDKYVKKLTAYKFFQLMIVAQLNEPLSANFLAINNTFKNNGSYVKSSYNKDYRISAKVSSNTLSQAAVFDTAAEK